MTRYDKKIRNSIISLITSMAVVSFIIVVSYFAIYGPHGATLLGNKRQKALAYASASSGVSQGAVAFFGDSITEMCDLDTYYPNLNCCNRGISGDTTEGMLSRLQSNVLDLSPSSLVFLGGTNDIGQGVAIEDIANNIANIITSTKESLPDCNVYIQSVYPVNPTRKPTFYSKTGKRTNDAIDELNLLLQELCLRHGCVYIDVNSHLKDGDGNLNKDYTVDGLHLTKQGYQKVASIITPYLETSV